MLPCKPLIFAPAFLSCASEGVRKLRRSYACQVLRHWL